MPKGDLQQGRVPTHKDVSVSLEGLLQLPQRVCHHKAAVVSDPAPVAPRDVVSEGRVPDSVVSDPLPTPAPISNPSQAANGRQAGTGEQGRVPIQQPSFSPRAAPRSDPSQAANDGSQAAGREQGRVPSVVQEAECQLIGLLRMP